MHWYIRRLKDRYLPVMELSDGFTGLVAGTIGVPEK